MFTNNAITLLVTLLLLQGSSCSTQSISPIVGKIDISESWKPVVYLVQPRNFMELASNFSGLVLDSAVMGAEGRFAFSKALQTEEKALFQLCIQKVGNRFPNQLLDDDPLISNYMPIVLQKGEPHSGQFYSGRTGKSIGQKPARRGFERFCERLFEMSLCYK